MKKTLLAVAISAVFVSGASFAVTTHAKKARKEKAAKQTKIAKIAVVEVPVVTSSVIGRRSAFDGSDLLVNTSSYNEDLGLLQQNQKFNTNKTDENRPGITLGGALEAGFNHNSVKPYSGDSTTTSDINLNRAELDVVGHASPWATGLLAFEVLPPATYSSAAANSHIQSAAFVDKAFVTIGNLDRAPVYFSLGQMVLPFGNYHTSMIDNPLTKQMGELKQRAALIGVSSHGFSAQVYGFNGKIKQSASGVSSNDVSDYGVNADYHRDFGRDGMFKVGAGYLSSFYNTALGNTTVVNSFASTAALPKKIPGANVNALISMNHISLFGNYTMATASDVNILAFGSNSNLTAAKPTAYNVEANYSFNLPNGKPVTLGASYGATSKALAFGLAKSSVAGVVSTSWWKNTVEGLEYRHNTGYAEKDQTVVAGVAMPSASVVKTDNAIIAQVGLYF